MNSAADQTGESLRILMVEDNLADAELTERELKRAGLRFESERVETRDAFLTAMMHFDPDLIISDHTLPQFDGLSALELAREHRPDTPFLFYSGTLGEASAVDALKHGASDYVVKGNLQRLGPAIQRAIEEAQLRARHRKAEAELHASERRFRLLTEQAPVGIALTDSDGHITYCNSNWLAIIELSLEESLGEGSMRAIHPDDKGWVTSAWNECLRNGTPFNAEYRFLLKNESTAWVIASAVPQLDDAGHLLGYIVTLSDITQRKLAEDKISRLSRMHSILSGINGVIIRTRERSQLFSEVCKIAVGRGHFRTAMIYELERSSGRIELAASLGGGDNLESELSQLRQSRPELAGLRSKAIRTAQTQFCNDIATDPRFVGLQDTFLLRGIRSTVVLPLSHGGEVMGVICLFSSELDAFNESELRLLNELAADVSFALDHFAKEERINYLAFYDVLTGLPNRALFSDRLGHHLSEAIQQCSQLALVMMDIERFRQINESFGRDAGDAVLRELASRIQNHFSDAGHVAKLGADNFAALIPNVVNAADIRRLIEQRFVQGLTQPFQVSGQTLLLSARAGVAMYPEDGENAELLFRNAEAALKRAKTAGEKIQFYSPDINANVSRHLQIETGLRIAIEQEQFVLHYQPKIDLQTGSICSVEALIRWNHPDTGLIPPGEFIPILESTGMIDEVGRWALLQALRDSTLIRRRLAHPLRIAVNVSSIQLSRGSFLSELSDMIAENPDHDLDLEITESLIMADVNESIRKLGAVRELGFRVAVDDFGTGYSSLSYIARLPIDQLKIDKSFIKPLDGNPENHVIVSSIISLAHSLSMKVVAEGVETEQQHALLHRLGCDAAQGYLFCHPLPVDQLIESLESVNDGLRLRKDALH